MTKRSFLTGLGLSGLTSMLAACSTLRLFSTFTPKDAGVRRVAHNVAYADGPRHTYDVYAPVTRTGPLPVVVFFYGGGWNSGAKEDYTWMGMALAAMGYVVAVPDYRLVPEVVYPAFLDDCAAAVRHIVAHAGDHGGDGKRLALAGHSAGAYNAVMLALDTRYLKDTPIAACLGISGPYDFYPFEVPESRNAFGAWPDPQQTQPVHYARKVDTRFLLMQSRADTVVYLKNAVNLQKALRDAGTDCQLRVYDGLSHADTAAAFSVPFRGKGTLYEDAKAFLGTVFS
ncbi:MAG: alpha/beta hydrolase [Asticcacaulis sp.]